MDGLQESAGFGEEGEAQQLVIAFLGTGCSANRYRLAHPPIFPFGTDDTGYGYRLRCRGDGGLLPAPRLRRHVSPRDKEVSGMARRMPVREMLRLRASGLSATAIARAQPVSKASVVDASHAADEKGIAWEDAE